MKVFMKIKRALRAIVNVAIFALCHKGEIAEQAVEDGLCDYSGQE